MAVIGLLSYSLLLPWLGFYYDDWPFAWVAHRLGPAELIEAFKPFRPFLAPYFFITTSILGELPILWHTFNLFIRILLAFVLWWTLQQIWPNAKQQTIWASLFFLVYPGFSQQWVSLTHSNQELIPHCFQLLSFGLMVKSIRQPETKKRILPMSLVLTFQGIFSTEYFLSLELLRPVVIWLVLRVDRADKKTALKETFKQWLPYLLILIANVFWLIAYQSSVTYQSYRVSVLSQFMNNLLNFMLATLQNFIDSFSLAAFEVWGRVFSIFKNPLSASTTYLIFGIAFLAFIALWLVLQKFFQYNQKKNRQPQTNDQRWAVQAILLGAFAVVLGRLPSWGVGLPLKTDFPFDRLIIPEMLGGSLFMVGLIEWLVIADWRKTILLSLIVSLAVGTQFNYGNTYRRDWEQQRDFFNQLNWRIPTLRPGTLLLTHELPLKYVTDNSLSAAINWIYDPDNHTRDMRYMLVYSKARLGSPLLPDLQPDSEIEFIYRTLHFTSRVGNALVIYYPTDGCLRVLDPIYTNKEFFPDAPYQLTDMIPLSNLDLTKTDNAPATMPPIIGSKTGHGWCYYFQRAELARQQGNWQQVVDLFSEVENRNLKPENPSEYLVFIEGLIQSGKMERAQKLAMDELISKGIPINGTCSTLKRISSNLSNTVSVELNKWMVNLNCSNP